MPHAKSNAPPAFCAPERGRHDKEGRLAALIAAGTAVFAELGYDAATTRAVAERAGCSEGLIHRYFGGKNGLLIAILEQRARGVAANFATSVPFQSTVEAEVREFLEATRVAVWGDRDVMRVTLARAIIDPDIGLQIGQLFNNVRVEFITDRLEQHRAAGRIDRLTNIPAIAQGIAAAAFTMAFFGQVVFQMDREQISAHCTEIARVLSRGLEPPTTFV
ncbi:MAG: helix-turn-helix domain-containing protein [Anaerolineaceae bacterium]